MALAFNSSIVAELPLLIPDEPTLILFILSKDDVTLSAPLRDDESPPPVLLAPSLDEMERCECHKDEEGDRANNDPPTPLPPSDLLFGDDNDVGGSPNCCCNNEADD